jgi:hypothetical protein
MTTTHLHFEIQVPTRDGYVRINPYMTLVAAYEHLIGARGSEIGKPQPAASGDTAEAGGSAPEAAIAVPATAAAPVKRIAGEARKSPRARALSRSKTRLGRPRFRKRR